LKCAEVTSCTGDPGNRSHDRSHEGCGARLPGFSVDPASCQKRKHFQGDEMEPETGRVPQVRLSVPGPEIIVQMLSLGGRNCPKSPKNVGLRPSSSTQVRWGEPGAPVWLSHPPCSYRVLLGQRLRQTFPQLVKRATAGSAGFQCGPAVCARARRWRDKRHW
jgi:hypothetical protein